MRWQMIQGGAKLRHRLRRRNMPSEEANRIRAQIFESRREATSLPLDESRVRLEWAAASRPVHPAIVAEEVIADGVFCDWVTAPNADLETVVILLHGGGYCMGSRKTGRYLASMISEATMARVLVPEYRLAPEHPFPAALNDVLAVWEWALDQGLQSTHMCLAGESAGGGLAVSTMLELRKYKIPLPRGAVLLSPWTDLECAGDSMKTNAAKDPMNSLEVADRFAKLYAGDENLPNPLLSPVHADLKGLPPLLIQVGNDEVFLDDVRRFADAAKKAEVRVQLTEYEGMWHAWQQLVPQLPEAQPALDEIAYFIADFTTC
jgi:acetyl esterase/lipase